MLTNESSSRIHIEKHYENQFVGLESVNVQRSELSDTYNVISNN